MNEASIELLSKNDKVIVNKGNLFYSVVKRLFDVIMSLISIVLLSPLFLLIIVLIKLDSKGKAIYKHKRFGKNGEYIYLYKFRTMYSNSAEILEQELKNPLRRAEWERNYKLSNDPRITKVGKVLRSTSLDELPQLFNILLGEMSIVGPRPIIDGEIEKYGKNKEKFLSVTPGLTGWWACNGRSCTSYSERIKLELFYVDNKSILLDLKIIFKTFISVITRNGAK